MASRAQAWGTGRPSGLGGGQSGLLSPRPPQLCQHGSPSLGAKRSGSFWNKLQRAFLKISLCAHGKGSACSFREHVHVGNQQRARPSDNAAECFRGLLNFYSLHVSGPSSLWLVPLFPFMQFGGLGNLKRSSHQPCKRLEKDYMITTQRDYSCHVFRQMQKLDTLSEKG